MAQHNVTADDMMMARDAVARAWKAVQMADAEWEACASEVANMNQASAVKVWKRAVVRREKMERRMWEQQDAA